MASGINQTILLGNLGQDPVLRHTEGGTPVCNFSVATTEGWTDSEGEQRERTDWHRVVAWGRLAETCDEYLAKGRPVFVMGRSSTREWEDQEGIRRFTTEVVALNVRFLGAPQGARGDDPPMPEDDEAPRPRRSQATRAKRPSRTRKPATRTMTKAQLQRELNKLRSQLDDEGNGTEEPPPPEGVHY